MPIPNKVVPKLVYNVDTGEHSVIYVEEEYVAGGGNTIIEGGLDVADVLPNPPTTSVILRHDGYLYTVEAGVYVRQMFVGIETEWKLIPDAAFTKYGWDKWFPMRGNVDPANYPRYKIINDTILFKGLLIKDPVYAAGFADATVNEMNGWAKAVLKSSFVFTPSANYNKSGSSSHEYIDYNQTQNVTSLNNRYGLCIIDPDVILQAEGINGQVCCSSGVFECESSVSFVNGAASLGTRPMLNWKRNDITGTTWDGVVVNEYALGVSNENGKTFTMKNIFGDNVTGQVSSLLSIEMSNNQYHNISDPRFVRGVGVTNNFADVFETKASLTVTPYTAWAGKRSDVSAKLNPSFKIACSLRNDRFGDTETFMNNNYQPVQVVLDGFAAKITRT